MSKGWKIVSIIVSLIFITVLLPIVLMSNPYMQLHLVWTAEAMSSRISLTTCLCVNICFG